MPLSRHRHRLGSAAVRREEKHLERATGNASIILIAPVVMLAAALLLTWSDALWRLDLWSYDTINRFEQSESDDSIVIVAIDERSLSALGRWPWPREQHARLIDRLTDAGVRGIALDVLIAEHDHLKIEGDERLAQAIARNGRVVMPVIAEPASAGSPLVEVLPLPEVVAEVAALGHTDIEPERDGLVRGVYLRAGLGTPHWSALALALLESSKAGAGDELPGVRAPQHPDSPLLWMRDNYVMLPQTNPESVGHVSAIDVINGEMPAGNLANKWVLIGVTAGGLGYQAHLPFRGEIVRVPGIAFHAGVLHHLSNGQVVTPVTLNWRLVAALMVVLVTLVMLSRQWLRWFPLVMAGLVVALFTAVPLLLFQARLWLPPAVPLTLVMLLLPLWLLIRLHYWQVLASRDPLTQVANRFQFDRVLEQDWLIAQRTAQPLSLLLIDIDSFKAYNDEFGHAAGDKALAAVAMALTRQVRRPRDLVARYGGEEFAVILPETDTTGARKIAEGMRRQVLDLAIHHPGAGHAQLITVSIGIGTAWPGNTGGKRLFNDADMALYRAKREGRNRVVAYADLPP